MKRAVVALAVFVLLAGMCGCASSQSNASSGASSPEQPASISSSSTAKSSAKTDYLSELGYTISLQGEFDAPYSVLANDEARSFVREETGKGTIAITESTEGCAPGQKKVTANLECTVDDQLAGPEYLTWYDLTAFDRTTGREFVNEDPFHEVEPKVLDGVTVKEYVNNVTVNGKTQAVPAKLTSQGNFPTFSSTLEITVPEDNDGVVFAYGRFDMDALEHFSKHAASISSEDELVFDKDYPAGYFKLFFAASSTTRDLDSPA
jgi:hypothetical protein